MMEKSIAQKEQAKSKCVSVLQKRLGSKAEGIDPQILPFDQLIEKIGRLQEPNFKFRGRK